MFSRFGQILSRIAQRLVPDPFVLAIGLTLVVAALGAINVSAGNVPGNDGAGWTVATGWLTGFSGKGGLAFALQMCLVLITGHALALSPPIQRAVDALARIPRSTAGAALLVAAVACIAGVVHWGLGAISGALVAREIARNADARGVKLHYPLLGAAAYAGLAVWHGGLSGSAPLKAAEDGHFLEGVLGVVSVSDTIFATPNLIITGALLIVIPLVFWAMAPRDEADIVPADPTRLRPLPRFEGSGASGLVGWLQDSPVVGTSCGVLGLGVVSLALFDDRAQFDINAVNLLFLFLGLTFQQQISHYVEAVTDGARGVGGIVLQFPFYFGILGIMKASGLIAVISQWVADAATADTFSVLAFLLAGLVNLFVPSGGGQWAVQGLILAEAGKDLGVSPSTVIMAFSYGDAWSNMLQPFWALPLMGIMGVRARDIIGYTAVIFVVIGVMVPLLLLALH